MKNEVDAYIAAAPQKAQPHLRRMRAIIRAEAPQAEEGISYRMPYYRYHGHLMYFAAFAKHVGLYPVGNADKHLGMKEYMTGKGTYQFPLDEPLPEAEIRELVRIRVKENDARAKQTAPAARPSPKPRSAKPGASSLSRRVSR